MTRFHRSTLLSIAFLVLGATSARAQYWGYGNGGAHTAQGDLAQGMGVYASEAGQYNVQTAQANAINANTALQFNQYVYQSRLGSSRIYHAKLAKDRERSDKGAEAVRTRLRDNPNANDIARGDALNVLMDELNDPKIYSKAIDHAAKQKLGGEAIRDVPFQYASAAISISVHQLTQAGAPSVLRTNPAFEPDRVALRGLAAKLRQEGDETGAENAETIQKAKAQMLATKAKIEATFPKGSADRVAADKYIKALYGFAKMLESPAVNVLLAGVAKHPDASLGELMQFMANFNLWFGAAETPRQREVYRQFYPMLLSVRNELAPAAGSTSAPDSAPVSADAPLAAYDRMSFDQIDGKTPPPAAPLPSPR